MKPETTTYRIPFVLVSILFFLWGIANNLNGILIPHLRKALELSNMQSTFVDTAVYMAYFLAAIPSGLLLKKLGYKKSILAGLLIFSIGAFLFIPAANMRSFEFFLFNLFIIGCGLTLLETAANPYATLLGEPETASFRLNLAQSFNGLAVFIGPMIGTYFILSGKEYSPEALISLPTAEKLQYLNSEAASVKMPYLVLGAFLIVIALIFLFFKFPEFKNSKTDKSEGNIGEAFKHKHLKAAVIAQFFYVGAQVCVTSFFIRMAIAVGGVEEKTAGYYLGIYGIIFMIGRFTGTIFIRFVESQKLLAIYSVMCILLSALAVFMEGQYVLFALCGLGFFMSIMFPTIFSLGIKNLNENTKPGSALLVMSIIGGAIFPVIMGKIIDAYGDNIQLGYVVPLCCYFIILWFGLKGFKPANDII
jgi:MFS transporter, FHS family, L-fucose permease